MRIIEASIGDSLFKCGQIEFAAKYADLGGRVFVYSFEEKYSTNHWPGWMGVPHRDEIGPVFGVPLRPGSTNTQAEKDLSKEIQGFWASFARHGTPKYRDIDWPMFSTRFQDYVKIRSKGTRVVRRPRHLACEVWYRHQRDFN
ncbi:carboxylic ester hydrolase [Elysia marginata]|uniref:Carboxylic ester hydrolase n=1 Tax=Elysia marginata TaxID=1093978 RepID=A0AAV4JFY5_9GAST|nr:carboxylic ester hydrolase [Elysia marginata]